MRQKDHAVEVLPPAAPAPYFVNLTSPEIPFLQYPTSRLHQHRAVAVNIKPLLIHSNTSAY